MFTGVLCIVEKIKHRHEVPAKMPVCASTGPALGRCCQHRTSTGPAPAHKGKFTGVLCIVEKN